MSNYGLYNWNKSIDVSTHENLILDLKKMIDNGQYWTDSPIYHVDCVNGNKSSITRWNYGLPDVFNLSGSHWTKIKTTFIQSCFLYINKKVQIKDIKSWGYITSLKYTTEDRSSMWHNHLRPDVKVITGVYYLKVPKNVNQLTSGTEFSPNGLDNDEGRFFMPANQGHWAIWDGSLYHRPGILQSDQDRIIIAADMIF